MTTTYGYPLVRVNRYGLEAFAARSGVHPDLLHHFVALGLLDVERDAAGRLWFAPAQLATVARIRRLRSELPVNYAALGLILDLLDQIEELRAHAGRPSS